MRIWNLMGGTIDWGGLPALVEVLDVEDVELLIEQLAAIRNYMRELEDAEREE